MTNKNIIVTGTSRGLGLEICRFLLGEGVCVFGISRTKSVDTLSLLEQYPQQYVHFDYDLSDITGLKKGIFAYLSEHQIPIHGLVNNAAISMESLITDVSSAELVNLINVNQIAPMTLTQLAIKNMLLYGTKGSIVHITSITAHKGYAGLALYGSTKGALEAFSKGCAREWGRKGIRSNCVAAGFMETEMTQSMTEEDKQKVYNRSALKEAVSTESVAATVSFLLNEKSKSITGQTIIIDAGII